MTLTLTIDLDEIAGFAEALAAAPALFGEVIQDTMTASLAVLEQSIVSETPVNTGALRGSIATMVQGSPLEELTGRVVTPLVYGRPVEEGRRPGKPPPSGAIKLWVERKLGLSGKEADSVAYLIARAIGRRGTEGQHMFEIGFDNSQAQITQLFEAIPDKVWERLEKS